MKKSIRVSEPSPEMQEKIRRARCAIVNQKMRMVKCPYFEFRNSYTKIIEEKQEALLRVKKEMKQSVTTGTSERNWVTLFKQYENIEELNRRVLMALVDRILIYEDHAIEIVFKYKDEYQQTLEYVLGYADELAVAG